MAAAAAYRFAAVAAQKSLQEGESEMLTGLAQLYSDGVDPRKVRCASVKTT